MKRTDTVATRLTELLGEIQSLFQDDVVLTLISRSLNSPDGSRDTVVTDDPELEEAVNTLKRLWRDPSTGQGLVEAINRELAL